MVTSEGLGWDGSADRPVAIMSSILDALKGRQRSTDRHLASLSRSGHADIVLETLGSAKKRSALGRLSQLGRFVLYAVATVLILLAVWAVI